MNRIVRGSGPESVWDSTDKFVFLPSSKNDSESRRQITSRRAR